MLVGVPDLTDPQLQRDYDHCLRTVREIAQRMREERFGRFNANHQSLNPSGNQTMAPALDYAALTRPARPRQTDHITLSLHKAAIVIGHNGEGLKRIEKMAQVKLQLDLNFKSAEQRKVLITGFSEDIAEAKRIIEEGTLAGGHASTMMLIPQNRIGLVIGKGGETIRDVQERSGAKVMVAPDLSTLGAAGDKPSADRIVTIIGDPASIQRAKDLIDEVVFGLKKNTNNPSSSAENSGGYPEVTVQVPEASVGAIIGKRAENLRAMQQLSGCRVFVEPHPIVGRAERNVHLWGPPEAIAYAQQLLQDKIATIDSAFGGGYGYDIAGGGLVYQSPGEFSSTSNGVTDPSSAMLYYCQHPQQ